MIVLALDTCLDACSAAVVEGGHALAALGEPMHRGQSERIGPMVREVVAASRVPFNAVDRVTVTVGPGSFTGLRVGLSFAKGLGLALGVPVIGIGTLQALAASVEGDALPLAPTTTSWSPSPASQGRNLVISAVDAKRGQVWMQAFRNGKALGPPEAPNVADAAARAAALAGGEAATLVGSVAEMIAPHLGDATVSAITYPDPVAIARLGAELDPAAAPPTPIYLRAPDAKLPGAVAP